MSVEFDLASVETVLNGMTEVEQRVKDALLLLSKTAAQQMQSYAQANASWTDRTGNARQKLLGDAYWKNDKILETIICHQMDYGVWLELAMNRKYAILDKAMNEKAPQLLAEYRRLLN